MKIYEENFRGGRFTDERSLISKNMCKQDVLGTRKVLEYNMFEEVRRERRRMRFHFISRAD